MNLQPKSTNRHKKILLVMWLAGGAHLSVCNSIKKALQKRKLWDVQIVNIVKDVCPGADPMERYFNYSNEDLYNSLVRHDLFTLIKFHHRAGMFLLRLIGNRAVDKVKKYMIREKPDFVISAVHHFNGLLARALKDLNIPFGVVPTELMDLEKTPLWFAPEACAYASFFSLAIPEMAHQGKRLGARNNCILSGGLTINPKFFDPDIQSMSRQYAREHFGFNTEMLTILVAMGGAGGKAIYNIIKHLENSLEKLQIIACCGRDGKLKSKIKSLKFKNRVIPFGFSDEMDVLLKASDLIITKPGPTSIWEALVMEVPIILDTEKIIVWEQPQVDFIEKYKLGKIVKKRSFLLNAIEDLTANNRSRLKKIKKSMNAFEKKDATLSIINAVVKKLAG